MIILRDKASLRSKLKNIIICNKKHTIIFDLLLYMKTSQVILWWNYQKGEKILLLMDLEGTIFPPPFQNLPNWLKMSLWNKFFHQTKIIGTSKNFCERFVKELNFTQLRSAWHGVSSQQLTVWRTGSRELLWSRAKSHKNYTCKCTWAIGFCK